MDAEQRRGLGDLGVSASVLSMYTRDVRFESGESLTGGEILEGVGVGVGSRRAIQHTRSTISIASNEYSLVPGEGEVWKNYLYAEYKESGQWMVN